MPNYSTQLSTWGDTGSEYPSGYSYEEGEQPVDAWDDFVAYHTIKDIQHLINVTNNDLLVRDGAELQNDMDFNGHMALNLDEIRVSGTKLPINDDVDISGNLDVGGDVEMQSFSGPVVGNGAKVENIPGNIYVTPTGASDPTQNDGDIWFQYE